MKRKAALISGLAIAALVTMISMSYSNGVIGDARVLSDNAALMLRGDMSSKYPLFLAIPALLAVPFGGNTDIGVIIAPALFMALYVLGFYLLGRVINLSGIQIAILAAVAALPFFMPNRVSLATPITATLIPLYLAAYFHAVKGNSRGAFVVLALFTISLPLIHMQLAQAVVIILVAHLIIKAKDAVTRRVTISLLGLLIVGSVLWIADSNWASIPLRFATNNIQVWSSWAPANFNARLIAIITNVDLIYTGGVVFLMSLVSFMRDRGSTMAALNIAMLIMAGLYAAYLFRGVEIGIWVGLRMRPFIYPLLLLIAADATLGQEGKRHEPVGLFGGA